MRAPNSGNKRGENNSDGAGLAEGIVREDRKREATETNKNDRKRLLQRGAPCPPFLPPLLPILASSEGKIIARMLGSRNHLNTIPLL